MDDVKQLSPADTIKVLWALTVPADPLANECRLSVKDDRFLFYWAGLDMLDSLLTPQELTFVEEHIQQCATCQHEHRLHERLAKGLPLLDFS